MVKVKYREYMEYLEKLYFTLRDMKAQKREYFNQSEYKWVLGADIIRELGLRDRFIISKKEPIFLFGIVVEIDYCNIYNVRILEDITNKIYIEKGAENDTSTEES